VPVTALLEVHTGGDGHAGGAAAIGSELKVPGKGGEHMCSNVDLGHYFVGYALDGGHSSRRAAREGVTRLAAAAEIGEVEGISCAAAGQQRQAEQQRAGGQHRFRSNSRATCVVLAVGCATLNCCDRLYGEAAFETAQNKLMLVNIFVFSR
jgi:hypothetical protein